MALIDEVSIIIKNENPRHVTAQQIKDRVAAALWELIEERKNALVYMSPVQANVRARDLYDAFAFLIGERKGQ